MNLDYCPFCGSGSVRAYSSLAKQASIAECNDCKFSIENNVSEDVIKEHWNKFPRKPQSEYFPDKKTQKKNIDADTPELM